MRHTRWICLWLILSIGSAVTSHARERYNINAARSSIGFGVHQFLGLTKGKFGQFSGVIELDREHPEKSSVEVNIAVKSIDTRIKKRDEHLCSPEFFDAEKYPQITFRSRSVKQTGAQDGDVIGDLNMHGVTRPIVLHVHLNSSTGDAQTRWSVTVAPITRRDFGLTFARTAEAISGIGQEVTVEISIEAFRAN